MDISNIKMMSTKGDFGGFFDLVGFFGDWEFSSFRRNNQHPHLSLLWVQNIVPLIQ